MTSSIESVLGISVKEFEDKVNDVANKHVFRIVGLSASGGNTDSYFRSAEGLQALKFLYAIFGEDALQIQRVYDTTEMEIYPSRFKEFYDSCGKEGFLTDQRLELIRNGLESAEALR